MIESAVMKAGSANKLATQIKCSAPFLSDVRRGNRGFGRVILAFLGLEVLTEKTYRKKKE